MRKFAKSFVDSEDGAVTVDWVVLTAAVVALGGAAYTGISGGATTLSGNTETTLSSVTIDPVDL